MQGGFGNRCFGIRCYLLLNQLLYVMKIFELQNILFEELKFLLFDWKFIKGKREFQRVEEGFVWFFYIGCINYLENFDVVVDVVVEFKVGKE